MPRHRLHPIWWLVIGFFTLLGINTAVLIFTGINLFHEFIDFIRNVAGMAMIFAATMEEDAYKTAIQKIRAHEKSRKKNRDTITKMVKVMGVIFVFLLILLYITQPSSVLLYWTGIAVGELFAFTWYVFKTFWMLFLGLGIGIISHSKIPRISYDIKGDPRKVRQFIKPSTITVHKDLICVLGTNGLYYIAMRKGCVWDGWKIDVAYPVIPEQEKNVILLKDVEGQLEKMYNYEKKIQQLQAVNENLSWELRQKIRFQKDETMR